MRIALERRDFLQQLDCFICNELEAGLLFAGRIFDEIDTKNP